MTFEKSVSINKGIDVDRKKRMYDGKHHLISFPDHCLSTHCSSQPFNSLRTRCSTIVFFPDPQQLPSATRHTFLEQSSQWPEEEQVTPKSGILVGEILTSKFTQWALKSQRPRPYEFTSHSGKAPLEAGWGWAETQSVKDEVDRGSIISTVWLQACHVLTFKPAERVEAPEKKHSCSLKRWDSGQAWKSCTLCHFYILLARIESHGGT